MQEHPKKQFEVIAQTKFNNVNLLKPLFISLLVLLCALLFCPLNYERVG